MNVFLENYIAENRATFKAYVRNDMARVSIRLADGTGFEASGRNYNSAMDKLLSNLESRKDNRKQARRQKQIDQERFLEDDDA